MASNPSPARSPWLSRADFWGWALFLAALGIRFLGIGWGMPGEARHQSLHPDEPWNWVVTQNLNPAQGDFSPSFYNYGTLYLTVVRAVNLVAPHPTQLDPSDPIQNWREAAQDTAIGRAISALAGAGTVWLVFLILHRRTSLVGAIAGGLILAVAPGHLIHSRFMTVDVFAAFLATASLYFALRLIPSRMAEKEAAPPTWLGVPRDFYWAGLFAGLTMGTKYSGVLVLLATIFALASQPSQIRFRAGLVAFVATVAAFLLSTPGILTEPQIFRRDFAYELAHTAEGHGLVFVATAPGALFHIANLMEGLSIGAFLLGLAGLVAACWRRHVWAWAVAVVFLVTFVLIARAEVKFFRYVIVLIPIVAMGAGWLIGQAHQHPNRRWKLVVGLGLLVWGGLLSKALAQSLMMVDIDPRDAAANYLKAQARPEAPIRVGIVSDAWFQTPSLWPTTALPRAVPFEIRERARLAWQAQHPQIQVLQFLPPDPKERFDWDVRLLDLKPDYIVASSFEVDDPARIEQAMRETSEAFSDIVQLKVSRYRTFVDRLSKEYSLDRMEGAGGPTIHDLMYIRPRVWIWKRNQVLTPTSTPSSTTSGSSGGPVRTP